LKAAALALGLCAASCGARDDAPRRPDVILIVVDTLRADRLSCYGYPRPTSPFVDQLAAEGALFEDVTAQYAWTVPSMVSLFSGRYVTDRREILVEDVPCLAQSFRSAGYRTLAEVANQLIDTKGGLARGFEHFDSSASTRPRKTGDPENSRNLGDLARALWTPLEAALAEQPRGRRAPFFLYLHALEPHHPYNLRQRLADELPEDGARPAWPDPWQTRILAEALAERNLDDAPENVLRGLQRQRGRYDQEVRFVDDQLRELFERLRELGLLEHAVLALVSDHGEGLWDHRYEGEDETNRVRPGEFFYAEHGDQLYGEALATPFVLWGAGVPRGVRVRSPVENVDLFPTLLELADVPLPDGLHGRSLVELVHGSREERAVIVAYAVGRVAVREPASGLKLVLSEEPGSEEVRALRLNDLRADPLEREDLAARRPDDVERLTRAFLAWRAAHGGGGVAEDLIRRDAEQLERMRRLGYMDSEVGAGRGDGRDD